MIQQINNICTFIKIEEKKSHSKVASRGYCYVYNEVSKSLKLLTFKQQH